MKKFTKYTALCAGITLASVAGASASLTSEAALMFLGIDQTEAVAIATQFTASVEPTLLGAINTTIEDAHLGGAVSIALGDSIDGAHGALTEAAMVVRANAVRALVDATAVNNIATSAKLLAAPSGDLDADIVAVQALLGGG